MHTHTHMYYPPPHMHYFVPASCAIVVMSLQSYPISTSILGHIYTTGMCLYSEAWYEVKFHYHICQGQCHHCYCPYYRGHSHLSQPLHLTVCLLCLSLSWHTAPVIHSG